MNRRDDTVAKARRERRAQQTASADAEGFVRDNGTTDERKEGRDTMIVADPSPASPTPAERDQNFPCHGNDGATQAAGYHASDDGKPKGAGPFWTQEKGTYNTPARRPKRSEATTNTTNIGGYRVTLKMCAKDEYA